MEILVLDGETKSALALVRALGGAGHTVRVGSVVGCAMAGRSRYAAGRWRYPSPLKDADGFIAAVRAEAKRASAPPLITTGSDATLLLLSRRRAEIADVCQLVLPSEEAVEIAASKVRTYELARTLDIPLIAELKKDAVQTFPVILKPRNTASWTHSGGAVGSAEFVFSHAELASVYERIETMTGQPPVILEYIQGSECGCEVMCRGGVIVQSFCHERVRSLSPRGGAAVVKRVSKNEIVNDALKQYAEKFVVALKWHGPLMVEGKVDERTGVVKLMELNGRFWGSLPLPQAAGVDFANGFVAVSAGGAVPPAPPRLRVMRTQHFLGDVQWLWRVLFARDPLRAQLYLPRWRAIASFKLDTFFTKGDVWRWRDPLPAIFEVLAVLEKKLWK